MAAPPLAQVKSYRRNDARVLFVAAGNTGANNDEYFGMQLGYDKDAFGAFTKKQYNGNIAGSIWRSAGDGMDRKYDYDYDAANRLLKADFTQHDGTAFATNTAINFNVIMGNNGTDPNSACDYNGNILKMQQWGLKINASPQINNLKYTYIAGTNKLKSVTDFSNDALTKLGDFKTNANHPQNSLKASLTAASTDAQFDAITDYTYDDNGNLSLDNNKSANSTVTYNHLNLPQVITITGKGSITYTYDAGGNKLRKVTLENPITSNNNKTITTTTNYINGLVYESKTTTPQDATTPPNYADVLQYIPHEEGRIRFKPAVLNTNGTVNTPARFAYDYSVADQVGNTRITLTDEQQQDKYPIATFEPAKLAAEKKYYTIADAQIVNTVLNPVAGLPTYPNNNGIGNNPSDPTFEAANSQYLYKLNGGDANTKMGLGITLKVMAGDRIDVFGKSYYFTNNPTPNAPPTNVQLVNILSGFLGGASGALTTNVHGPVSTTDITNTPGINATNGLFTNQQNQSSSNLNKPRAFINYIFFD
jgi:hypothetical protein